MFSPLSEMKFPHFASPMARLAPVFTEPNEPYDVTFSRFQWTFHVYGLRTPYFYQRDGINDNQTICYCNEP